ncbi:sigma factor G inhibitor Gin [Bacillus sp. FJAT-45037]|uniref:sigma factor G inhibitor Gin n=1 Tax=Bacillus sp. FJAT-45037 TaxID=2011007 RepID=UPI001E3778D7|nr:sigma factor G inhibitor Gin [Bacillus sp. FJAT-45037]
MRLEVIQVKKTRVIHVRLGENCVCCQRIRHEGIRLFSTFICQGCEREIITTDCQDIEYETKIDRLRYILPTKK